MNHSTNLTHNGLTVTIAKGDTLTVALPYAESNERTAWSFDDNFGHNPNLNLRASASDKGLRTMEFVASIAGTVEIAVNEHYVLGFSDSSSFKRAFRLTVKIV